MTTTVPTEDSRKQRLKSGFTDQGHYKSVLASLQQNPGPPKLVVLRSPWPLAGQQFWPQIMPLSHCLSPYFHLMQDICTRYSSVYTTSLHISLSGPSPCLANPSSAIRPQLKATLNLRDSSNPLFGRNKWGPESQVHWSQVQLRNPNSSPCCQSWLNSENAEIWLSLVSCLQLRCYILFTQ